MTIDVLMDELSAVSRRIYSNTQQEEIDKERLLSLCSLLQEMSSDISQKVVEFIELNNHRYII